MDNDNGNYKKHSSIKNKFIRVTKLLFGTNDYTNEQIIEFENIQKLCQKHYGKDALKKSFMKLEKDSKGNVLWPFKILKESYFEELNIKLPYSYKTHIKTILQRIDQYQRNIRENLNISESDPRFVFLYFIYKKVTKISQNFDQNSPDSIENFKDNLIYLKDFIRKCSETKELFLDNNTTEIIR